MKDTKLIIDKELFIMLKKVDYTGKTKSLYECDKCR